MQVGALAPASLGELGDGANDGFGGRAGVASRSSSSLLEQDGPPLGQLGYMPGQHGPEHLVATAEVIVDGRSIALAGGPNDLRNRDVVDATLGKESSGGIEEEVACGRRLGHGVRE